MDNGIKRFTKTASGIEMTRPEKYTTLSQSQKFVTPLTSGSSPAITK
jgi:hypothetical protein